MGNGIGHREVRPVWNNAHRINHQNKFVPPSAVLTRSRRVPDSVVKQSFPRAAASTSAARPVNTAIYRNRMNVSKSRTNTFHKTHSPIRRPFYKSTAPNTTISNEKVNAIRGNPQQTLKNKGFFDSRCSRHMTGNKDFLTDYQEIVGGFVAFGGSTR
ncbi:hypothetical protein Tco_1361858 [Tanacetum coccineum]